MITLHIPETVFRHHFWGEYAETMIFAFSISQKEQADRLLEVLNQMEFAALVPDPCGGLHQPMPFTAKQTQDGRFWVLYGRLAGADITKVRDRIVGDAAPFRNSIDQSSFKNLELKV